jgi:ABC-type uncharacterized transport system substrate-binding protein
VTSISRSSVLPPEYLQALSNEHVQAVIVLVDGMFFQERKRIAQLAASARLPAVYGFREHVDAGGLISYGVNLAGRPVSNSGAGCLIHLSRCCHAPALRFNR